MAESKKLRENLDRPITQHEADIIRWLLEHGNPKYLPLASQIGTLRVVSKCTCGCPTVDFDLGDGINSYKGEGMILDCGATIDDQPVGVLLFVCRGLPQHSRSLFLCRLGQTVRTSRNRGPLPVPQGRTELEWAHCHVPSEGTCHRKTAQGRGCQRPPGEAP